MTTVTVATPTTYTGPEPARTPTRDPVRRPALRTVLVARDEIVRHGLVHVLGPEPEIEVVGHHGVDHDLDDLVHGADLLVVDPDLGAGPEHGLGAIARLREHRPGLRVVLLGGDLDDDQILAVVRDGVDAVVSRTSGAGELVAVLRSIAVGTATLDRTCAAALVRALRERVEAAPILTPREREVVALVARGQRNRVIARTLFVSEATVKFHTRNIMAKLGAHTRAEVVAIALRLDLG